MKQFFTLKGIEAATDGLFPFRSDGFTHELVKQDGPVCLVRRHKKDRQLHYEVVRMRWREARTWPGGQTTPAHFSYPDSEEWGTNGFTYRELSKARRKYDELCLRNSPKSAPVGEKPLSEALIGSPEG
jgi:hypothetical protein